MVSPVIRKGNRLIFLSNTIVYGNVYVEMFLTLCDMPCKIVVLFKFKKLMENCNSKKFGVFVMSCSFF